ncbi:MAG: tRNA (N6-isopentenyl adenosine(37)-C2)-methylthiotransferase MiaB [Firmicutes bacterium]|nr:tRNA (N6-isopentenyl adenosine(37)-C2)-methylthiotransferase MiaB [Bacillota bacterium]
MNENKQLYYKIITYGCQMNEHDAEILAGQLQELGYAPTDEEVAADLVILVTCAVREHAEQRVYGKIGELYRLKQANPNLILAVGGCMSQQSEVAKKMRRRFPYLDIIFGTHNLAEFPDLLRAAQVSQETVLELWEEAGAIKEALPRVRQDGLKAWTTIMYGCNNFCTYCIVPYVRGRERSRRPENILAEIENLVAQGYQEVTLLGQNVNSYGKDLDREYDFADLLRAVNETGIQRIRFMTSHPKDISPRLIEAMADCSHVMEHLHLPVQAGSNRILRAMNRRYTRERYLELVQEIRAAIPDICLTTDVIVGFPGETDEDFADTLSLMEIVRYDAAFTFAYSPRGGTPAARMLDQVPEVVSKERLQRLNALQTRISLERNQQLVGTEQEILVEGPSKNDPGKLTGRTRGNKLVHFVGEPQLAGQLVHVRITAAQTWNLFGELI